MENRTMERTAAVQAPSPRHGQHTREVLQEVLGLSAGEIAAFDAAGAFGSP